MSQMQGGAVSRGASNRLLHLCDVQLDMGVHLQILVMRRVDLILDVFFQVGHLFHTRRLAKVRSPSLHKRKQNPNIPSSPPAQP